VQGNNHAQLLILLLNFLVQKIHVLQALLDLPGVIHRFGEGPDLQQGMDLSLVQ
jgi:hypothetical protein